MVYGLGYMVYSYFVVRVEIYRKEDNSIARA